MNTFSSPELGFNVNTETWNQILAYYRNTYGGVIPDDFPMDSFAKQRLESGKVQLARLQTLKVPKQSFFLDAGCGIGSFLILALKAGYNYYGYEVDKDAFAIARKLLKQNGLDQQRIQLYEKGIPFKKQFDCITSFEVAEHVGDLNLYIKEISSVLSANGKIFIETPNYLIPYEPHYYVFLPPILPKQIAWVFCKVMGRKNYKFFKELNFVTPISFSKAFNKSGLVWENLGQKEWYQQLSNRPSKNRSDHIKKFSEILRRTGLKKAILYTAKLGIYTPQVYLAYFSEKNENV